MVLPCGGPRVVQSETWDPTWVGRTVQAGAATAVGGHTFDLEQRECSLAS